jgi:hypothetical protein
MSPAVFYRYEDSKGQGWRSISDLHCYNMPNYREDTDLLWNKIKYTKNRYFFAFTPDSFVEWVTARDKRILARKGFKLRAFMCPPGTFRIGADQAVFIRDAATEVPRYAQ